MWIATLWPHPFYQYVFYRAFQKVRWARESFTLINSINLSLLSVLASFRTFPGTWISFYLGLDAICVLVDAQSLSMEQPLKYNFLFSGRCIDVFDVFDVFCISSILYFFYENIKLKYFIAARWGCFLSTNRGCFLSTNKRLISGLRIRNHRQIIGNRAAKSLKQVIHRLRRWNAGQIGGNRVAKSFKQVIHGLRRRITGQISGNRAAKSI